MKTTTIENDIKIYCVTAKSYPNGILAVFQKLHSLIPFSEKRKYISVSRPENGGEIVYHAGATELEIGDLSKHNLDTVIVKKGNYVFTVLKNYKSDITAIGKAFETLLKQPNTDPEGYCVEWYINNDDVKCMVRIID